MEKEVLYNNGTTEKVFFPDTIQFYNAEKVNLFFDGTFNADGLKEMFEFSFITEAECIITEDYFLLRFDAANIAYIHNV